MDKQREEFEAWVREYGNYPRRPELKTSDGAYHYLHTESEWRAWQAAQAAQPAQPRLAEQRFMVNTMGHYCHSMKTQDSNSPATCLKCNWNGLRQDLNGDQHA